MKTRNLILAAAALMASTQAMAEQRTETQARQLATQYVMAQSPAFKGELRLVSQTVVSRMATPAKAPAATSALATPYYIYNLPEGGYIVVSGTTALDPVIAFSETGSLDPDAANLPDGLRYWLGYAAEAAAYAEVHPEAVAPHPAKAQRRGMTPGHTLAKVDYYKDIAPLLESSPIGNIQWGQDAPYYDQCPMKGGRHCYTGCMATAMAQVLAYHQYPKSYDWSEILASYKGGKGTSAQRSEVARLNHDVGVALNMEYGTDQSGSVSTQYSKALRDKFGINENVALVNRDNFTYGEWMDILLNEFMEGRPVIYDGVSNDGGHAFVIDGYRAKDGFVHVNWGWEGLSDGYYNIIFLDPKETGIGAVLSSGFTSYQDAVVGIEPDRSKDINYYLPIQGYAMQGELVVGTGYAELAKGDRKGYISFTNIPNMKSEAFNGTFGALFVDKDGEIVGRAKAGTVTATASTMNSNPHATPSGGYFEIPELADGVYRVYCYVEDNNSGNWTVLRTAIDKPNFMTMTQANGRAFFEIAQHHPTNLKASDWSFETKDIEFGSTGLKVTLTNTGDEVEYGTYAFSIDVPNQLSRNFYDEFHRILPGKSETITIPVVFDEYGEYSVRAFQLYRLNGGGSADIIEPFSVKFRVDRSLAELLQLLHSRRLEVQAILDKARLSGNYSEEACDALQKVLDDIKSFPQTSLDVAGVNALLQKLEDALAAFYASAQSQTKSYWGYVDGKESQITTSWCPGNTKPGYFGISIPESDLSAYVGGQIVGLRCLFGQNRWYNFTGDDIIAKVFLLDYDGGYPGNHILATSKAFSPTHYAVYDEYLFDTPYTIGAGGVLCCAEVTTPHQAGMYGAMGASREVYGPGACWMNNGSGWEDMYGTYGNEACGIAIQAIIVGGGSVTDGKLTNVSAKSVAVGADITITGSFQNLSSDAISSYDLAWAHDDDGQSGSQTIKRNVAPGETVDFSLSIPGFTTTKLHTVRVSVKSLGGKDDMIADNSTVDIKVPVTAHSYVRNVVCEEHTGTWCGWCPRGIVAFDYMKEKYGDRFIGVSLHSNDQMEYNGSNYTPLRSVYLNSAPSGIIDRKPACYTQMNKAEVEQLFLSESAQCIAQVEAQAYYDEETGKVLVNTNTEFGYDFTGGDYRLSYLVIEDQLGKYMQANYYAGGNNGAMSGWETKGSTVAWMYDDVLREQFPSFDGKVGSIPSSVVGGKKYKYTYTFNLPSNVKNPANVRIAVLILDPNTVPAEIVNAVQTKLQIGIPGGIDDITTDATFAPIYDLSGRRVNSTNGVTIQGGRKQVR
ncbi:MAG: C10 family peptidase [Bacteroidales bacterium]|nr:C10 family peptidase [Bacteroidales bacterium]